MRVRVRGSARVRVRVRGSARVRDRAIRSKTAEVLGAKTPATKKKKIRLQNGQKEQKEKEKKHNQQSRRQKICILNSHQPENNQRQQIERTRSETARRKRQH